jgi:hypothetical protein
MKLNGWHKLSGCGYKGYVIKTTGEGLYPPSVNNSLSTDIYAELYTAEITYMGLEYQDEIELEMEMSDINTIRLKHTGSGVRQSYALTPESMGMARVLRTIEMCIDKILNHELHKKFIDGKIGVHPTMGHITSSALPSFDTFRTNRLMAIDNSSQITNQFADEIKTARIELDKLKELVDMGRFIPPPPQSEPRVTDRKANRIQNELTHIGKATLDAVVEHGPIGEVVKILKTNTKIKETIQKVKIWLKTH